MNLRSTSTVSPERPKRLEKSLRHRPMHVMRTIRDGVIRKKSIDAKIRHLQDGIAILLQENDHQEWTILQFRFVCAIAELMHDVVQLILSKKSISDEDGLFLLLTKVKVAQLKHQLLTRRQLTPIARRLRTVCNMIDAELELEKNDL